MLLIITEHYYSNKQQFFYNFMSCAPCGRSIEMMMLLIKLWLDKFWKCLSLFSLRVTIILSAFHNTKHVS